MPLLVGPGGDLDAKAGAIGVGGESAGEFEPIDHAKGAVEPAAIGLSFAVRADQQPAMCFRIIADYIADAVDDRIEPGLAQPAASQCREATSSGE